MTHHAGPGDVVPLLDSVRARGARVTPARRAVLEVVLAAGSDHLSADEVAERVHLDDPGVHLSTVYRTLESLEALGILRQARLGSGPVSYHLADDLHHHAVCDACGAVIDLPPEVLRPVAQHLADEHGFLADPHHLAIRGRCADCRSGDR